MISSFIVRSEGKRLGSNTMGWEINALKADIERQNQFMVDQQAEIERLRTVCETVLRSLETPGENGWSAAPCLRAEILAALARHSAKPATHKHNMHVTASGLRIFWSGAVPAGYVRIVREQIVVAGRGTALDQIEKVANGK
jgi:hypothetical protein